MPKFEIDKEITRARTIPSGFYTEPEWFDRSLDTIFRRSWQFAGRREEISNLLPQTILSGSLDEPVLFVDRGDRAECLSNVCTHRGKLLVEEPCRADLIRCGYHGRRFGLDGKFLSMPEFEGVEDFPSEDDDLANVPCEEWNGFVFAGLEPAEGLGKMFGAATERVAGFDFDALQLAGTRSYRVKAHWALYCENYLEGFHIPYVHPELNKAVDYGTYTTELFRFSSLQTGRAADAVSAGSAPFTDGVEALYLFLFPNTMLNFYPWGVSVNVVLPLGRAETEVRYFTYVSRPELTGEGAGADLDTVELEDQSVVESVQKGIRSRYYDRGRYSPTKETGTHHFHRLIAEFLG